MTTFPWHRVAASAIAGGLGGNLILGALGRRTLCTSGREHAHLDKPTGRFGALVGITATAVGFGFHFLDPAKRPVRALARLVDDAHVDLR